MEKELSLKEIMNEFILFFINFRNIIVITTILGTLSVVLFQKLRPAYFETTAIATSGISNFERQENLNQASAINLINLLQIDLKKKDYIILSEKMNISVEEASAIKSITAKDLFKKDADDKEHATSKFSIDLSVKKNKFIPIIQDGLVYYFKTNIYVTNYYDQFVSTTSNEINAIDQEVNSLRTIRESEKSAIDISSINVNPKESKYDVNNQVLELINLRSKNITDLVLLKPLSFVSPFTKTQIPERGVLILGFVAAGISFLLGIIIAVFKNVYIKSKE
jgi:hypothetical protein